jgi:hypothetical protein
MGHTYMFLTQSGLLAAASTVFEPKTGVWKILQWTYI